MWGYNQNILLLLRIYTTTTFFLILAVFAFIQSNNFSKLCFIILRFILFKIYMYNVITKYIIFLNILNVMYYPN